MTAKDKANELFEKMNVIHYVKLGVTNKDSKGLPVSMYEDQIKQCALIAVEEILNAIDWHEFEAPNKELTFWNDVKKEIYLL